MRLLVHLGLEDGRVLVHPLQFLHQLVPAIASGLDAQGTVVHVREQRTIALIEQLEVEHAWCGHPRDRPRPHLTPIRAMRSSSGVSSAVIDGSPIVTE